MIDGTSPPLPPGVVVQVVVSAADQLVVENRTTETLEVLDDSGRPFIRVGSDGAFGDLASTAWHRSTQPDATGAAIGDDGAARWTKVSAAPSWGWFDHRIHPAVVAAPPAARPGAVVVLDRWEVPMVLGGRRHVVTGRREFVRHAGAVVPEIVAESVPTGVQASAGPGRLPALFVDARGAGTEILFLGDKGEPMVRLRPDGAEGNLASPTFAVTAAAGRLDDGGLVGAEQPPRWKQIATGAAAGWLEPRGAVPSDLGVEVLSSRKRLVLRDWSVPFELRGQRGALRGVSRWVPDPGLGTGDGGPPGWLLWAGSGVLAVAVGGGVGAIVARRRR